LQTYEDVLSEIALKDDRVVVLTAENRAAIRNLPALLGPRFIDFGICEQTMVGAAAGLALRGRIPVVHALAAFLTMRAFEFIRTDVGIGRLPVKLVGGVPGLLSEANGPTHQAIEDISLMRGIPGMQVVCPADAEELAAALPAVMASASPCYIRHTAQPAQVVHKQPFAFGRAERLTEGTDVAILTYGTLVSEAVAAERLLSRKNVSTRVVNLRTLSPIDTAEIEQARRECGLIVTLEDHFVTGGLFSILAEHMLRQGHTARVLPIALESRWFTPALLADVLECEGLNAKAIAARIERALTSGSTVELASQFGATEGRQHV